MRGFGRAFGSRLRQSTKFVSVGIATGTLGLAAWASCEGKSPTPAATTATTYVLAADVGGTNSRFKLYRVDASDPIELQTTAPGELVFENKYANFDHRNFQEIVEKFLDDAKSHADEHSQQIKTPVVACLALAGVVTENRCRLTNLDWLVCGSELGAAFGIKRVELINDFVAQGYGTLTLGEDEVTALTDAKPRLGAPIGVLGAGTGLGECFLTMGHGGVYGCHPSEGGHKEWAPRGQGSDDTQLELLKYLKIKFSERNRISVERVVSGPGICNVYDFLAYRYPHQIDKQVHKAFMQSTRNAATVATNATPGSLCEQALQIFTSCYGAEAGVLALTFMPFGGLYLTGGVTEKLADRIKNEDDFMEAYFDKGRVSPLLYRVPLYIVNIDDMGERGSHLRAVQILHEVAAGHVDDEPQLDPDHILPLVPARNSGVAQLLGIPGASAA